MYLVSFYIQGGKEGAKAESQGFSPLFTFTTFKSFICPPYLHCIACCYFMRNCYGGINEQGVRIFRLLHDASRKGKNSKNNKRAYSLIRYLRVHTCELTYLLSFFRSSLHATTMKYFFFKLKLMICLFHHFPLSLSG